MSLGCKTSFSSVTLADDFLLCLQLSNPKIYNALDIFT